MTDPHLVELVPTARLRALGRTSHEISRLVATGMLRRLRRGVFVADAQWRDCRSESRAIIRARAWALASASPPTFSHHTAAALWGLPLFRCDTETTHTLTADPRPGASPGVARHRPGPAATPTVSLRGLTCTSLAQTMVDVARIASAETALPVADAALRRVGHERDACHYDAEAVEVFRASAVSLVKPGWGSDKVRRILEFADGRADGPAESVSRLYLSALGFTSLSVQVRIPRSRGRWFDVDLGLDDVGSLAEVDGVGKYSDPAMLRGRTPQQALLDEKRREDWIRGVTGKPVIRWGLAEISSPTRLARHLASFSVHAPNAGRPSSTGA